MLKFVVSCSRDNMFTMEIQPITNGNGSIDMGKTMKHVLSIVDSDARVELV